METLFTKMMLLKGFKRIEKVRTAGPVCSFLAPFPPEMVSPGILPPYLSTVQ